MQLNGALPSWKGPRSEARAGRAGVSRLQAYSNTQGNLQVTRSRVTAHISPASISMEPWRLSLSVCRWAKKENSSCISLSCLCITCRLQRTWQIGEIWTLAFVALARFCSLQCSCAEPQNMHIAEILIRQNLWTRRSGAEDVAAQMRWRQILLFFAGGGVRSEAKWKFQLQHLYCLPKRKMSTIIVIKLKHSWNRLLPDLHKQVFSIQTYT